MEVAEKKTSPHAGGRQLRIDADFESGSIEECMRNYDYQSGHQS